MIYTKPKINYTEPRAIEVDGIVLRGYNKPQNFLILEQERYAVLSGAQKRINGALNLTSGRRVRTSYVMAQLTKYLLRAAKSRCVNLGWLSSDRFVQEDVGELEKLGVCFEEPRRLEEC